MFLTDPFTHYSDYEWMSFNYDEAKKYNTPWGAEYVVCFAKEPTTEQIEAMIEGLTLIRALSCQYLLD